MQQEVKEVIRIKIDAVSKKSKEISGLCDRINHKLKPFLAFESTCYYDSIEEEIIVSTKGGFTAYAPLEDVMFFLKEGKKLSKETLKQIQHS